MKTSHLFSTRSRSVFRAGRQDGMAVIVVMALIALILIYLAANLRTLNVLHRELQMIEQQQIRRLATPQKTNTVALTNSAPAKANP